MGKWESGRSGVSRWLWELWMVIGSYGKWRSEEKDVASGGEGGNHQTSPPSRVSL